MGASDVDITLKGKDELSGVVRKSAAELLGLGDVTERINDAQKRASQVQADYAAKMQAGSEAARQENTSLADLAHVTQIVTQAMHGLRVATDIVVGGAKQLAGALTDVVKSGMESEMAVAKLEAVLAASGDTSGQASRAYQQMAAELQKTTRFSDEAILSAVDMLMMYKSIGKEAIPQATRAMADLAEMMGVDIRSAATAMGRALEDPATAASSLRRAKIMLTDTEKALLKTLSESGQEHRAQAEVLRMVEERVGGVANKMGGTLDGQIARITNRFDEMKETIGKAVLPGLQQVGTAIIKVLDNPAVQSSVDKLAKTITANLQPVFEKFVKWLESDGIKVIQEFAKKIEQAFKWINDNKIAIGQGFDNLGKLLGDVLGALRELGRFAQANPDLMKWMVAGGIVTNSPIGAGLTQAVVAGGVPLAAKGGAALVGAVGGVPLAAGATALAGGYAVGSAYNDWMATQRANPLSYVPYGQQEEAKSKLQGMYNARFYAARQEAGATEPLGGSYTMAKSTAELQKEFDNMKLKAAENAAVVAVNSTEFDKFNAMVARGTEATLEASYALDALNFATTKLEERWAGYADTMAGAMAVITTNMQLGEGYGVGGGIAGGKYGPQTKTKTLSEQIQDYLLAGTSETNKLFQAQAYALAHPSDKGAQAYYKSLLPEGGKAKEPTYADRLMAAFGGNVGAGMAWESAFAGQHGGKGPGSTDVRDYMASQKFAAKYGKGPSQEDWEKRYYSGSFEGVDETGLDPFFGKGGTLTTLLEANAKAEADHFAALAKSAESGNWKVQLAVPPAPEGSSTGAGGSPQNNVPGYASGGMVSYPTLAWLAERGPEMVTPLKKEDRGQGNVGVAYNLNIYSSARTENVVPQFALLQAMASVKR